MFLLSLVTVSLPVYAVGSQDILEKLRAGDLDDVEASYASLKARQEKNQDGLRPLSVTYGRFPIRADLLPLLDAWCEQHPSSAFAFAQRGRFYLSYAWQARGSGWAHTVSDVQAGLFQERVQLARQDLEKASTLDPTDPYPPAQLIWVAIALGWPRDNMEEQFQRAMEADPADYTAYYAKLTYLMPKWHGSEQDMFTFARRADLTALQGTYIPMVLIEAHLEKAYALYNTGQRSRLTGSTSSSPRKNPIEQYFQDAKVWGEVEDVLRRLLEDLPASELVHGWFGLLAAYAGREELARQQFGFVKGSAFAEAVFRSDDLKNLRWACQRLGLLAHLERMLLAWRDGNPENPQPYAELAALSRERGEPGNADVYTRQANEASQRLLTVNADDNETRLSIAWGAYKSDPDLAIEHFKQLITAAPQDPRGYAGLAYTYIRKKNRYDEAKLLLVKGLLLDPTDAQMHNDLGSVLAHEGKTQEAIKAYRTSLSLNPDDPVTHFNFAQAFYEARQLQEAIQEYQEAIRLSPPYVEAYYNLGWAHYDLGRFDQARESFQHFLALNPSQYPDLVQKATQLIRDMNAKQQR